MSTNKPILVQEAMLFDMKGGAVERLPDRQSCEQLNARGNGAYLAGELAKAEALFIAAHEADPTHPDPWGNLGLIWHTIGAVEDAQKCYMKALELNPAQARTWCNLGILNEEMGFPDHAERMFLRALEIEPTHARSVGNLAQLYLKRFDFVRGWSMIERRLAAGQIQTMDRTYADMPRWNGLPTKKLAIWPEQGVGDQVLYGSLLYDLLKIGQPFVCELDERLIPAFERAFRSGLHSGIMSGVSFVPKGHKDGFAGCTAHIPIMSLAYFLRRSIESFEAQRKQFLYADRHGRCFHRERMGTDGKKVAISWRSFHHDINKRIKDRKSASLDDFAPLGKRSDLQLVTVQYGDVRAELDAWTGHHIHRPDVDLFNDIDDVLAVIDACDAVVTTSNVTAHFAGALGKETYLISSPDAPLFYHRPHPATGKHLWYPSVIPVNGPSWRAAIATVSEML